MTAPVVKWVGGKTALLPEIVPRLPKTFRDYYEPFAGGAALFFDQRPAHATLNDANFDLIDMYRAIALNPDRVIRSLSQLAWRHNEPSYYRLRDEWNRRNVRCEFRRAAMFIYLNKTCFNGLWRVNRKGHFNVPMGEFRVGMKIFNPAAIHDASDALARTVLKSGDYWSACSSAGRGDFVYIDPPYDPVSKTSNFTGYTKNGFGRDEQIELATRAKRLVDKGAFVMLSNSNTRLIRSIYRAMGFRLHKVLAPRAINSDISKRRRVAELLIIGGYEP